MLDLLLLNWVLAVRWGFCEDQGLDACLACEGPGCPGRPGRRYYGSGHAASLMAGIVRRPEWRTPQALDIQRGCRAPVCTSYDDRHDNLTRLRVSMDD